MSLACAPQSFRIEPIAHGRAIIGVSACPGGGSATLAEDLDAVTAFRPDAIITLMSAHELRLLGRGDLLDILPGLTPQWHHIALRVGAAPDARFKRLWAYTGHRVRAVLRRGGRVLVHCDAGGARARWIAALLLAELGVPAGEAATRTRAPRLAATIDPPRNAAPICGAAVNHHMAGKILGCLFGGALGDAFGYPVEFKTWAQIRTKFGDAGLVEPQPQAGPLTVSDDTQMTLFTGEGVLTAAAEGGAFDPAETLLRIRHAYLAWLRTQREDWIPGPTGLSQYRELWAVRAPGSTCLSALRAGARGTPTAPINESKGCGALMRVAPLGLLPGIGADAAFDVAHAAAALTHGHAAGRLSAAAFASLLRDLLAETPLAAALGRMEVRLQRAPGGQPVLTAVQSARALATSDLPARDAIAKLGQGWTGDEALAIGLYAVLRADSFEGALRLAANHDGDSDTTASVAGQLWGVLHGIDALPHAWVRRLDVLEPLCDVAGRLVVGAGAAMQADA
ncbi:MAG: ADP-ribosylglycohydrolase family protein, partial [Alphaproteobacteria bacterium]|nr:ADP-ribosylglycohydrolase family protein [Alphaproteobacteria bacterium]